MAWTFPLSLADFYDKLRVAVPGRNWELARLDQLSGLGSGQPLRAELASPLWGLQVQLVGMGNAEADAILSLLELLNHPGRAFYFSNPKRPHPLYDPNGTLIAGFTPTIHTLNSNNRQMRIEGLPAGYRLTAGDMISWDYGNPARRAFHRITETVTASGAGLSPLFEVYPFIRPGSTTGIGVTLAKPAALAEIVPGTFDPGSADTVNTSGITFNIMQRLR